MVSDRSEYRKKNRYQNNRDRLLKNQKEYMESLRQHLESQFDDKMSWDNYGSYWHIDHIVPQKAAVYVYVG